MQRPLDRRPLPTKTHITFACRPVGLCKSQIGSAALQKASAGHLLEVKVVQHPPRANGNVMAGILSMRFAGPVSSWALAQTAKAITAPPIQPRRGPLRWLGRVRLTFVKHRRPIMACGPVSTRRQAVLGCLPCSLDAFAALWLVREAHVG